MKLNWITSSHQSDYRRWRRRRGTKKNKLRRSYDMRCAYNAQRFQFCARREKEQLRDDDDDRSGESRKRKKNVKKMAQTWKGIKEAPQIKIEFVPLMYCSRRTEDRYNICSNKSAQQHQAAAVEASLVVGSINKQNGMS